MVDFNGKTVETANTMQVQLRSKFNHEGGVLLEPEPELIQTLMAQKPMLRVEVGARALRVQSVPREEA